MISKLPNTYLQQREWQTMTNDKKIKLEYASHPDLRGKIAIVTGATGFLGQHLCEALARNGVNICLADTSSDSIRRLEEYLRNEFGIQCTGLSCDISNPEDVIKLVDQCRNSLGEIAVLFNNAAAKTANMIDFYQKYENYKLETWRNVMSVNIDGMFLVSQAVGNSMINSNLGGVMVQTASIYGVLAPDHRIYTNDSVTKTNPAPAVYSVSKAAVIGLTNYLSAYWANRNIRVNSISPGGIFNSQDELFVKSYSERVPMKRMGTPQEFVNGALFLASEDSSYITGQNLILDGGLSSW